MIINGKDNENDDDDDNDNSNFHVVARPWKLIYQGYTV